MREADKTKPKTVDAKKQGSAVHETLNAMNSCDEKRALRSIGGQIRPNEENMENVDTQPRLMHEKAYKTVSM